MCDKAQNILTELRESSNGIKITVEQCQQLEPSQKVIKCSQKHNV